MGPLVTTEWLADELGKPDLVVFDATKYLPNETQGRARRVPATPISPARAISTSTRSRIPIPTCRTWCRRRAGSRKLLGALGYRNASRVVFYDQKGLASAARGWWLMGLFGHDAAAVLDGGLPKWRPRRTRHRDGAPAAAVARRVPARLPRGAAARCRRCAAATWQTQAELVLDARAAGRFTGEVPEPRAGMRSGHIPGSASLPYTDLLNADGTFRPVSDVRARLAQAGVDGSRPVVTSCGSGVTACILTLGLRSPACPAGAVYDGSWTEWGGRADTPVETK